jgi:predicted nucleic acid-binding protein
LSYLLDTNVLSEGRRKRPDPGVVAWLERTPEKRLFLSVLVLGEIRKGIAKLNDTTKQGALFSWLEGELTPRFAERLLGVDVDTALIWGRLSGERERRGEPLPVVDTLLAATALRHNLTLVTRNARDFGRYPVEVLNPWQEGEL